MRIVAMWFLMFLSWCLGTGCFAVRPMSNKEVFGGASEAPGIHFKGKGIEASASSDIVGHFHGENDPTTGKMVVDASIDSNSSKPLEQYPPWINAMAPIQQMNFQWALLAEQEKTKQLHDLVTLADKWGTALIPFLPQLLGGVGGGASLPAALPAASSPASVTYETLDATWATMTPKQKLAWLARVGINDVVLPAVTPAPPTP